MLNSDVKDEAIKRLKNSVDRYNSVFNLVNIRSGELFELRRQSSKEIIQIAENYINTLSNTPKEFEKAVNALKFSFSKFNEVLNSITNESEKIATIGGTTAGAGALAGAGVAAFGPTAALAIATTFGTASTGTAIATLSGAAATNAALAWLGGGAMIAGGGGMAAGNALLALAGPIGWAIGGVSLIGSGIWVNEKNKQIAEEANSKAVEVNKHIYAFQTIREEISKIIKLTKEHSEGAKKQLEYLKNNAPKNYFQFNTKQKNEIMALVNNIESLSKLLSRTVGN